MSASWVCRFQWISNSLPEDFRPLDLQGEEDGSGLVIDWNGNAELAKLMDEHRVTKATFLKATDELLGWLPAIEIELAKFLQSVEQSEATPKLEAMALAFENAWDGLLVPPLECQRLNQAIQELLATVGNVGLVFGQRKTRGENPTKSLMRSYQSELSRLKGDISFLRHDVR